MVCFLYTDFIDPEVGHISVTAKLHLPHDPEGVEWKQLNTPTTLPNELYRRDIISVTQTTQTHLYPVGIEHGRALTS